MDVLFIQDQEIHCFEGRYYHSKAKKYFSKFLFGLSENDRLIVLTGVIYANNKDVISGYSEVTDRRIIFKRLPNFRNILNFPKIDHLVKQYVRIVDFCYLRSGIASSYAWKYCKRFKKKYMAVLCEDVYKNTSVHKRFLVRALAPFLDKKTKNMALNSDYAFYVTKYYLQKRYPSNGKTLGCSDVEDLTCSETDYENRIKRIENNNGVLTIGMVGSLSAALKGHATLLKAFSLLAKEKPNKYKLEIVGGGNSPDINSLIEKLCLNKNVSFLGERSRSQVLNWMETIDIYVHPSKSEGLPRTILEAMSKGLPCICSDVGGVSELINKKYLFTYNSKSPENDLKNLIAGLKRQNMIEQANANFLNAKEYSPAILERRIFDFFSEAIIEVKTGKNKE